MSVEERERTQYDWTHDKVQIIAATIAFGMGASLSAAADSCPPRMIDLQSDCALAHL